MHHADRELTNILRWKYSESFISLNALYGEHRRLRVFSQSDLEDAVRRNSRYRGGPRFKVRDEAGGLLVAISPHLRQNREGKGPRPATGPATSAATHTHQGQAESMAPIPATQWYDEGGSPQLQAELGGVQPASPGYAPTFSAVGVRGGGWQTLKPAVYDEAAQQLPTATDVQLRRQEVGAASWASTSPHGAAGSSCLGRDKEETAPPASRAKVEAADRTGSPSPAASAPAMMREAEYGEGRQHGPTPGSAHQSSQRIQRRHECGLAQSSPTNKCCAAGSSYLGREEAENVQTAPPAAPTMGETAVPATAPLARSTIEVARMTAPAVPATWTLRSRFAMMREAEYGLDTVTGSVNNPDYKEFLKNKAYATRGREDHMMDPSCDIALKNLQSQLPEHSERRRFGKSFGDVFREDDERSTNGDDPPEQFFVMDSEDSEDSETTLVMGGGGEGGGGGGEGGEILVDTDWSDGMAGRMRRALGGHSGDGESGTRAVLAMDDERLGAQGTKPGGRGQGPNKMPRTMTWVRGR